jgi:hypothetical protein
MAHHPLNYTVHFFLELAGLYALGLWGWTVTDNGGLRVALAIGLPVLAAAVWGIFGTTGDSRGAPVIKVPGWVRLVIELGYFALATGAFFAAGATIAGLIFGLVALVQVLTAYDRLGWLLTH